MKRAQRALATAATALAVLTAPAAAGAAPPDADRGAATSRRAVAVPAGLARDPFRPFRAELQRRLDDVVAAGAVGALAEVRDEHGVWRGTSGVAERGTTRPVPAHGRFRAGSVTKTFLATIVLQLAAEGRLRLDDPVEAWLPSVVPDGRRITVRHLLNHTSGLYDFLHTIPLPPDPAFLENRWRSWTADEQIRRAVAQPPTFRTPGSRFAYSNTGYLVLGRIVEEVTGRSYREEITRRVIRPLRLHGTEMPGTKPWIRGPHPHGYVPTTENLVDYTESNPSVMGAAGALISSAGDLNRFFAALLGGRLLPGNLLAEMRTQGVPGGRRYGLGLGWWDTTCGVRVYGNDGDTLAYQAYSFSTKDRRHQVTVALTPDFRADPDEAVVAFLDKAVCG